MWDPFCKDTAMRPVSNASGGLSLSTGSTPTEFKKLMILGGGAGGGLF